MVEEEEIKEDESGEEVLKRLLESTMDYLVTHEKKELKELIKDFKEEAGDEYTNDVLKLEKLIDMFILEEVVDGKPIIPMINEVTRRLESSPIARSKQHDMKKNPYRLYSILLRLNDFQCDEDMTTNTSQQQLEKNCYHRTSTKTSASLKI